MRRCRVSSPLLLYQVNLFKFVAQAVEPDWPRLQKIGSGSPSTCNRGNVFAEIGPFPCRVGNKNAPRCCFLAIAANEKEGGENFKDF